MIKLNKNQFVSRTKSVISGGDVEEISSIENFPVFIGSTTDDISSDMSHNLTFDICKETGMIQLRDVVSPDIIYPKFHSEAIGKVWSEHHESLSELILKYSDNKTILEIPFIRNYALTNLNMEDTPENIKFLQNLNQRGKQKHLFHFALILRQVVQLIFLQI